jgi:uncharacterized SAM-binding protein YcdF (DUF218 family)
MSLLKALVVPGSLSFLLLALSIGVCLLYRKKDGGRAGRRVRVGVVVGYWIWSTPVLAGPLVNLLTPDYPAVQSRAQARGANAIVLLGAGVDVYRSRGDLFEVSPREDALRIMEAVRVYHALDKPWVIVTGGMGSGRRTEAVRMGAELELLGVAADRIVLEPRAQNTHEHAIYVPPLLRERHVTQFVLVTSRQHIARALRVFRKAGWDPVPSTPEAYGDRSRPIDRFLPEKNALLASEQLFYGEGAFVYYWLRGWL